MLIFYCYLVAVGNIADGLQHEMSKMEILSLDVVNSWFVVLCNYMAK